MCWNPVQKTTVQHQLVKRGQKEAAKGNCKSEVASVSCRVRSHHLDNKKNWCSQVDLETWTSCVPLGLRSNLGTLHVADVESMEPTFCLKTLRDAATGLVYFSDSTAFKFSECLRKIVRNIKYETDSPVARNVFPSTVTMQANRMPCCTRTRKSRSACVTKSAESWSTYYRGENKFTTSRKQDTATSKRPSLGQWNTAYRRN